MRTIAGILFLIVLVGGWVLFGAKTMVTPAPGNASVIMDLEQHRYASPPCVVKGTLDRELIKNRQDVSDATTALVLMDYAEQGTIGEVRDAKAILDQEWHPDRHCANADGFMQMVSLAQRLFGYRSRWTPTGEWRW